MGWLRRRGLLPEHFYQFSLFHLETAEMWQMVINCWLSLRRFWPPGRRTLRRLAAAHPGVLEAHFGERDKVIPLAIRAGWMAFAPSTSTPVDTDCSGPTSWNASLPHLRSPDGRLAHALTPVDFRPRNRPRCRPQGIGRAR